MKQVRNSHAAYFYWRGSLRETTKAILPDFVKELAVGNSCRSLQAKVARVRRIGRGNVVIIDSWGKDAFMLALAKVVYGFYLVLRLRGDPFATIRANGALSKVVKVCVTYFLLSTSDVLVFNSKHLLSQKKYRKYSTKSHVVYNPVMYENLVTPRPHRNCGFPTGLRILSVMSFGWMEKIRPLGEAIVNWVDAEFLTRNGISWTICGVGEGTYAYHWFVGKVLEAEQSGSIQFIGYQEDMPPLYASHDVLAHLSGLEAFPNAVLEASYCALPTITIPESGGTLEAMEDGATGFIVANGPAFREALLGYAHNPAQRLRHGANARANVLRNFSIESQKSAMTTILRKRFG